MTSLPAPSQAGFIDLMRQFDSVQHNSEAFYRKILKRKSGATQDERFAALYGLLFRLRREARFPEFVEFVRKYETEFSAEPLFDTFRVTAQKWQADDSRSLRDALGPAQRALSAFPKEPGVLHSYAELVATLAEMDEHTSRGELDRAIESVNLAIQLSPTKNANHFSTRARLMLVTGDYRSARTDVATASSLEDPSGSDFLRRITRYESIRSMINLRRVHDDFVRKEERLVEDLNAFRREQLQMLGLLAAVIALIVGGTLLASKFEPDVATRLVLLSAGAAAMVFVALAGLLARAPWGRVSVAFVVAAGLLAAGIWLPA